MSSVAIAPKKPNVGDGFDGEKLKALHNPAEPLFTLFKYIDDNNFWNIKKTFYGRNS